MRGIIFASIAALFLVAAFLPSLETKSSATPPYDPKNPPSPEELAKRWAATQAALRVERFADARRDVIAHLRDPSSATFGKLFMGNNNLVCGYVNARNGFGGMTGMQPFIAGYARNAVIFYQSGAEGFMVHWKKICE